MELFHPANPITFPNSILLPYQLELGGIKVSHKTSFLSRYSLRFIVTNHIFLYVQQEETKEAGEHLDD